MSVLESFQGRLNRQLSILVPQKVEQEQEEGERKENKKEDGGR